MAFFVNNKFFCTYCLCYSLCKTHRLIQGVEYVKNCRITETSNHHENERNHIHARKCYLRKVPDFGILDKAEQSEKRSVLNLVVKIIIFIATHGLLMIIAYVICIVICKFSHDAFWFNRNNE